MSASRSQLRLLWCAEAYLPICSVMSSANRSDCFSNSALVSALAFHSGLGTTGRGKVSGLTIHFSAIAIRSSNPTFFHAFCALTASAITTSSWL